MVGRVIQQLDDLSSVIGCIFAPKTDPAFALNFDPPETLPMRAQVVDKLSGSASFWV